MKKHYIYGIHAIFALLKNKEQKPQELLLQENRTDKRIQEIISGAKKQKIIIRNVSKKDLQKIVGDVNHQGVVAIVEEMPKLDENNLFSVLDNEYLFSGFDIKITLLVSLLFTLN